MSDLKLTCGTRTEARCVDYEGTISSDSPLFGETHITIHDIAIDLYSITDANIENFDLFAPIESPTFTGTVGGITKAMISLTSVDDTADVDKPISTAQAVEFATKLDIQAGYSLVEDDEITRLSTLVNYTPATYTPINITTTGNQVIESMVVNGFGAVTSIKLRTINAVSYEHPATHPPTIIAEDSTNRFVTDAQISLWTSGASMDESAVRIIVESYGYITNAALAAYTTTSTLNTLFNAKEDTANKDQANGYLGLNASGNIVLTGNVIIDGYITATGTISSDGDIIAFTQ